MKVLDVEAEFETNPDAYVSLSQIRAVLSQIRETQRAGKTPTLLNIAGYGSNNRCVSYRDVLAHARQSAPVLREAIKEGRVYAENRAYYLTETGVDLLDSSDAGSPYIREITTATRCKELYRANRGTRIAAGTRDSRS